MIMSLGVPTLCSNCRTLMLFDAIGISPVDDPTLLAGVPWTWLEPVPEEALP